MKKNFQIQQWNRQLEPRSGSLCLALGASALFLLNGCQSCNCEDTNDPYGGYPTCSDVDQDGFYAESTCVTATGKLVRTDNQQDCDDYEIATYPGAEEQADKKDNDCDDTIDEGTTLYDDDGDGYTDREGDCDDADDLVYPGATELLNDNIDSNCDGYLFPIVIEDPETYDQTDAGQASLIVYGPSDSPNISGVAQFVGDLDGDSRDDFVYSAAFDDGGARLFVVYTPEGGLEGRFPYDEPANWILTGVALPNTFAFALAHGDLNGDGFEDLVVGDYYQRRVSVFYGGARRSGETDASQADITFRPLSEGAFPIGDAVAVPGDLDQDGYDDLLIGQPAYDMGRGRALIFYGRPDFASFVDVVDADASLEGLEDYDGAGSAVASLGDMDGDTYPDFALTAPFALADTEILVAESTESASNGTDTEDDSEDATLEAYGRVYLYYGGPDRLQGTVSVAGAPANLASEVSDPAALSGVALATGDVDGDGARDLVAGLPHIYAEEDLQLGLAVVLYGDSTRLLGEHHLSDLPSTLLRPRATADAFGATVAVADLLGDGKDDVVVACKLSGGDTWADGYALLGYVAVFEGKADRIAERVSSEDEGTIIDGAYGVLEYTYSLDAGGDVNQDGRSDLLIGNDFYPDEIPQSSVLLFHGGALP